MNVKYFKHLCGLSQKSLKATVANTLKNKYKNVFVEDGFVFAQGEVPILLVAHLDTVHKQLPEKFVYENGKLSSPNGIGGDDRCGVYAILEIINKHKCYVLFCEDEEIGGIGARAFVKSDLSKGLNFNYIIELDRTNKNDAVFYSCANDDFEKFITKDGAFKKSYGSFSDISVIAPALGFAAVNISCGYYKAHTNDEYVVTSDVDYCIKNVINLIERTTETDKFEYIEAKRSYYSGANYYNSNYRFSSNFSYYGGSYYDDDTDDYMYGSQYSMFDDDDDAYARKHHYYSIVFEDKNGEEDIYECFADSKYEALGKFMRKYPKACFDDVIDVADYGEDYYNI